MENGYSDGGRARVPGLKVNQPGNTERIVEDNVGKEYVFRNAFFPPPPQSPNVPENAEYPEQSWNFAPPTNRQIIATIRRMKNGKATKPGTMPNDLFKATSELIVPYLGPIYRATFTLRIYPADWSSTETIILKKPGRSDYRDPNAWRPITLSNGHGRLMNGCVAEEVTKQAELLGLLPALQFG
ncbi:hypothetical protein F5877DRAFT_54296, partial [Lentinula edodes]